MGKRIAFRPLRRIRSSKKIAVASYMQWRKIKTADYGETLLDIKNEYKDMDSKEFVYNHKGEQLFWFNHTNPEALPKNKVDLELISKTFFIPMEELEGDDWKYTVEDRFDSSVRGFDCDDVPVFSHYTAKYIATNYTDMSRFEPLTVGMVTMWFGWFLWKLNNTTIILERQ